MASKTHDRYPLIPGWSPLEDAEKVLFPDIPYEQQTRDQRNQIIRYAKDLYETRTGIRWP